MSLKARARKDEEKKKRIPHKYTREGVGESALEHYTCPIHDKKFLLTPKQITGEKPINCIEHELFLDFTGIKRIMEAW